MPDENDIVVCVGKVIKVEEVPMKNGIAAHTQTLIDFTDDAKLMSSGNDYAGPTALKKMTMMAELKYGKKYEVILREIKPKVVSAKNDRKFQESQ